MVSVLVGINISQEHKVSVASNWYFLNTVALGAVLEITLLSINNTPQNSFLYFWTNATSDTM